MTPPISKEEENKLNKLYYDDKNFFGRDRLYKLAIEKGINISRRQIMEWLKKQHLWQLYAPAEKTKNIQSTIIKEPHKVWGIDIIDMGNNEYNGYKYILSAIDLFSKKSYVQALKSKDAKNVNNAFKKMIKHEKPKSIRSDNGSEFINESFKKLLEDNGIKQIFSSPSLPQSNGNIERFNGIIKKLINKDMIYNISNNWVDSLQKLNDSYNNTNQRIINDAPNDVDDNKEDKEKLIEIRRNIYKNVVSKRRNLENKFKIGDYVRIKLPNEKNKINWTNGIFKIVKMSKSNKLYNSPSYYVADINNGEIINKKYYENDLLLIPGKNVKNKININERYEISKILEFKIKNKIPGYIVKWKGYKEPTWEPRNILIEDVPKLIKKFDEDNGISF